METQSSHTEDIAIPFLKGMGAARLRSVSRTAIRVGCLVGLLGSSTAFARSAEFSAKELPASPPDFVLQPLYASNQGSVHGIYESSHADLVLVRGGFDSGFRTGMVCRIEDGSEEIGEVMVVDVRGNCAAAIILQLESGQVIEPGHSVRVKTVKF